MLEIGKTEPPPAPSAGYCVAQLGARMGYAVPQALNAAGLLRALFTDFSVSDRTARRLRHIAHRLPLVERIRSRCPPGIDPPVVRSFHDLGLRYALALRMARTPIERENVYSWIGEEFCQRILKEGVPECEGIFAYNTAALLLLRLSRERQISGVVEQTIAPRAVERTLLEAEREKHPGWYTALPPTVADPLGEREEEEWRLATRVICGSAFVRDGLVARGVDQRKIRVIPYGVDPPLAGRLRQRGSGPLRILFVGGVSLRKGAPALLAVARRLTGCAVLRVVGPILVPEACSRALADAVELVGAVPHERVWDHFSWAHVLFLPSVCEGSATVTYEALATGLPVVCTPNTGSSVVDGGDGVIVPHGDVDAMAACLAALARDRDLLESYSRNALQRRAELSVSGYGRRLISALPSKAEMNGRTCGQVAT